MPIEVTGLDILLNKVKGLEDLDNLLRRPVDEGLDILYEAIREYPPPPPNSTYIRTFNLQNSWRKQNILREDILGRIFSDHPNYNKYVQSRPDQAQVHQGRWQTVEDVGEDNAEKFNEVLDDAVQEYLNE